jgi:thiol-activated cytolysin
VKASGDANSTSVVAFFKQVFYTVSMDTPRYPSEVFSKDLTVKSLGRVVSNEAPPAYVRSVDYGRILMVRMDTTGLTAKADAIGAFKQAIEGGEVEGYAKAKYEQINRKSTFSAVVLGGGTSGIVKFAATEDGVKNLKAFIEEGVSYTKSNPGIPVSYNVAFLNNNKMATIGLSTNYTERESIEYPNGYVKIRHGGWYVAKIRVTWEEAGVPKEWTSGEITRSGNVMTVDIPGDAKSVKIVAEGATGIAWDPWDEAMNVPLNGPDNRCYTLQGTTLDQSYAVAPTPQDPCP